MILIRFIEALLHWSDDTRRQTKLGLTIIFFDLLILVTVETLIGTSTKTLLSIPVIVVGVVWIIATALTIWLRGGVIVDGVVLAEAFGLEPGSEFPPETKGESGRRFLLAICVFGMIHVWIVSFFALVPFWQFWPGYWMLMLALMGWGFSAAILKTKFDWDAVRKAYIAMTVALPILTFLIAGFAFSTGKTLSVEIIRQKLQDGLGLALMFPVGLLILSAIPKIPGKRFLRGLGVLSLVIILGYTALEAFGPKIEAGVEKLFPKAKAAVAGPPAPTCPTTAVVYLPAGEIKRTGVFLEKNQYVNFRNHSRCPDQAFFFIHGRDWDKRVAEGNYTEYMVIPPDPAPHNKEVWLRGGPLPTTVTVAVAIVK